jgi:thioredoxin-related protein
MEGYMKAIIVFGTVMLLTIMAGVAHAKAPQAINDLQTALETAKSEGKLLFIQYGRETCGNCRALKSYITSGQLRLPQDKYVYVDMNCDDANARQAFRNQFKVNGNMLPFVVIADSDGKQLAGRAGYGKPQDFAQLIRDAKKSLPKQTRKTSDLKAPSAIRAFTAESDVPIDPNRKVRNWKTRMSDQIKATLYEMSKGYVALRKEDGSIVRHHWSSLSKEDQDYIQTVLASSSTNATPAETQGDP